MLINTFKNQIDILKQESDKPAIFLINFGLQLQQNENYDYKLQVHIDNTVKEMVYIFSNYADIQDKLLLLVDDKDVVIKNRSNPTVVKNFNEANSSLDKIRRDFLRQPVSSIVEKIFNGANITKPNRDFLYKHQEKYIFSELKLHTKSTLGLQNTCAKIYDSLLRNIIDRNNFILISLIPSQCRSNISNYLNNNDYMNGIEEIGGRFLTAFIDSDNTNPYIIHI